MNAVRDLFNAIEKLVTADELAAVFIHLNDTYIIEDRKSLEGLDRPGMARISTLVKGIKERANGSSRADRVLVLHSGDFLSPSYLSNRCDTFGEPMLAALESCQLDLLTLGNHEFDHDKSGSTERLVAVLGKARRAKFLAANIKGRNGLALHKRLLWPSDEPFVALFALAGADTVKAASEHGLGTRPWELAAAEEFDEISRDGRIGYVVILSHMDREEDRELQRFAHQRWHEHGVCHIFGGHDHHVHWREPGSHCSFSKNLANGRTVTVALLTKATAAAPPRRILVPARDVPGEDPVERVKAHYLRSCGQVRSPHLRDAYLRHLDRVASDRRLASLFRSGYVSYDLADWARLYALSDFQSGWTDIVSAGSETTPLFWHLTAPDLASLTSDSETDALVSQWSAIGEGKLAAALAAVDARPDDVVVDFSGLPGVVLDARDKALRAGSTDFGNFVADCIQLETGADLALIHAGSFRSDEAFGPVLRVRDLAETFIYDGPDALVVTELTGEEVDAVLAHSIGKGESGAFLQVSAGAGRLASCERVRTAIASHLLKSNQDGYQAVLARLRKVDANAIRALAEGSGYGTSLIDLIVIVAGRVAPSNERRLEPDAVRKPIESWTLSFLPLVDRYVALCRAAEIDTGQQLSILQFGMERLHRRVVRLRRTAASVQVSDPEFMNLGFIASNPDFELAHWTRQGYEVEHVVRAEEIDLGGIKAARSLIYEEVNRLFHEKLADTDIGHGQFMLVYNHLLTVEERHRNKTDYEKFLEYAFDVEMNNYRRSHAEESGVNTPSTAPDVGPSQ